jgi:predicted ATPase
LIAALLTPRPPSLLVLNEPETSLHPDLLPALGRLIIRASRETQVWVVSHAPRLVAALEADDDCHSIALNKELGETRILGQGLLDAPPLELDGLTIQRSRASRASATLPMFLTLV